MTSQCDLGNFKPLYMSNILGYPRQIPLEYKNFLTRFTGGDRERVEYHMRKLWDFFLSHPINDDVEDLVMKLFSNNLYCNASEWYDNLPDANITTI
jgi:hypothetical protein